ncbi:endo alpha-1,4 polygalactosaminidase, partial [Sulfurivirga sp.]|uniref:endo alpha-1,4 polygalactosaminidase n=1 Tax=Sulfurivirga sp. TaxID=2614236 RepID=UPI0025E4EABD
MRQPPFHFPARHFLLASILMLAGLPNLQAGSRLPDHAGRFQPDDRLGIQLQVDEKHPLRVPADATVMEVDLFDTPASTLRKIKNSGRRVLCYFSAGSREAWRPDARHFPRALLGKAYTGWPQERWLDIRHPALRPLIAARLELARRKGCDGVDPDNVNGFENPTGFALTLAGQLRFNRW